EAATLLNVDYEAHPELEEALFKTALAIKERIYGKRIVIFAPLYAANYCCNGCLYCGYNAANHGTERSHLTPEEVESEVKAICNSGHKRILMLCGEHPNYTFDDFLEAVQIAAKTKSGPHGEVRRINVEVPVLSVTDLKRLKATDAVGTYTVFQESYHRPTYKAMHPWGPKSDYDYRLTCMDRSMMAGIDDVGIGALFGLYDWKYEVLGLLQHANHLNDKWKCGPHTISIPRLKPAKNAPASTDVPHAVSDAELKRLVAIMRLAVPYTGMILSTRESAELRSELLDLGISQLSAGSRTAVGSYDEAEQGGEDDAEAGQDQEGQFELADHRTVDEIIYSLMEDGYVPSACTACYRVGRTGEAFMKWAKTGSIHNCCLPNAVITLQEYLEDYAPQETKELGEQVIADHSHI
ncbi:[FeFe]-hydrogenase maturation HydG, radical SAM, partial [Kipferlia bialata]